MPHVPELMTVADVAAAAQVTKARVWYLINSRVIGYEHIDGRVFITERVAWRVVAMMARRLRRGRSRRSRR